VRRQIAVLTAWVAVCCFVDVTETEALALPSMNRVPAQPSAELGGHCIHPLDTVRRQQRAKTTDSELKIFNKH
jgi:hypothetical protein